jgi:nucleotide-binding universal stress UspA family protein
MYRSILVPLDGSAASEHMLPVAFQIAHNSGAALRLVSVATPAGGETLEGEASLDVALPARGGTRAEAYLEQIRERLTAGSNLTITADILREPNSGASATCAPVIDTDLVILATHRHSQLVRFQLRDITDALVRWRPASILALRTTGAALDSEPPEFQRMLIPLDGSALAEQILAPAVALGTSMQATYTLLHVVEPYRFVRGAAVPYTSRLDSPALVHEQAEAQDYLNGIALLMRAAGLHVQTQVAVACDARTAIWQAARQQDSDVIAMTTHGRGGLSPLLVGSVAMQVLRNSHLPVLLYRPQERAQASQARATPAAAHHYRRESNTAIGTSGVSIRVIRAAQMARYRMITSSYGRAS